MHKKIALALIFILGASALHLIASSRSSTAQTNVHVMPAMTMNTLQRDRTIRIYLPPSYTYSDKHYPVLYMHDGQNLFDDATSYVGEWGVDESLNQLAKTCGLEVIVVGIDHGDKLRRL